ncbi:MAG: purine-nucleoside phosphorylase, partial [Pelagibacteraceae bacterium TMED259]
MLEQYDQITAACEAIQKRWPHQPKVGIILGSGLGNATQGVTDRVEIPYEE